MTILQPEDISKSSNHPKSILLEQGSAFRSRLGLSCSDVETRPLLDRGGPAAGSCNAQETPAMTKDVTAMIDALA